MTLRYPGEPRTRQAVLGQSGDGCHGPELPPDPHQMYLDIPRRGAAAVIYYFGRGGVSLQLFHGLQQAKTTPAIPARVRGRV